MHIVCSVLYLITKKSLSFAFNLIQVNCTNDFGVQSELLITSRRQVHHNLRLTSSASVPRRHLPETRRSKTTGKNIKRSTLFLTESKQIKNQQFEVTLPRNEI